ncbi:MAG TPA: hypothetical protein ENN60_02230, partial [archaeon]|nr:hypothetical protein [archaeon]
IYVLGNTKNELGGSEFYRLMNEIGLNVPKVDMDANRRLYETHHEAVRQGLLRSSHGVYLGGLGVHLALVSVAGDLGASVDLRKLAAEGVDQDYQALYSESAGRFIVTVSPENQAAFENVMDSQQYALVGQVTSDQRLCIQGLSGDLIVNEAVDDLRRAYHSTFDQEVNAILDSDKYQAATLPQNFSWVRPTRTRKPKVAVLTGYGINCDGETQHAFNLAGALAERVHMNELINRIRLLEDYQLLFVPGGFSYGDELGAGTGLANKIYSHMKDALLDFLDAGNLMGGHCNGAQVMVKLGIIPGKDEYGLPLMTLTKNDSNRYEDRWVYIQETGDKCIWTKGIGRMLVPVAHGEGKFYSKDEGIYQRLLDAGQVAVRYVMPDGSPAGENFPYNPNGSHLDIGGVCNESGTVFSMMPHPERALYNVNLPTRPVGSPVARKVDEGLPVNAGIQIFQNAVNYAELKLI